MTKPGFFKRAVAGMGGLRNVLALAMFLVICATIPLDILYWNRAIKPLDYSYLFFAVFMLFYGVYPLYVNRRLTRYYWDRIKRHRLAVPGMIFILFLIAVAIIGPFFTGDAVQTNFKEQNFPPLGFTYQQGIYDVKSDNFTTVVSPGVPQHPLGTDDKGRDMLAMLISGARVSLQVGFLATLIAVMIGSFLGVSSAYFGGWVDSVLMRFTDIMMTFPFFLLLILIIFLYGPSLMFIILVIGATGWTGTARLVRSDALSLRTRDFIIASRSLGASDSRIIFRHMMPNVLSQIIVIATLSIPGNMLAESGLSFIGLGDPNVISWGAILNAGFRGINTTWWVAVEPGVILFLTVLAFNFLGDGLRDAFDPRSQS